MVVVGECYNINPRYAIELAILKFNPNISDEDLLNLREEIYLDTIRKSNPSVAYIRDYTLYSKMYR